MTARMQDEKKLAVWLFALCFMVTVTIFIGGLTRLMDAGLSITAWQPVTGIIPPLSESTWRKALALYQETDEYQHINMHITLEQFKTIYWWEWSHRLAGRMVGVVFLVPLLWFWWHGTMDKKHLPFMGFLLLLGMGQGVLGWIMVQSGLKGRVDVDPYLLMPHLGLAFFILYVALTKALTFWHTAHHPPDAGDGAQKDAGDGARTKNSNTQTLTCQRLATMVLVGIFIQILLGGLTSGFHLGKVYNTWPTMNGAWLPPLPDTPTLKALAENPALIQFFHRTMAMAILILAGLHYSKVYRVGRHVRFGATVLLGGLMVQILLGILTLIMAAPLALAFAHHGMAVVVFCLATWHRWQMFLPEGIAGNCSRQRA